MKYTQIIPLLILTGILSACSGLQKSSLNSRSENAISNENELIDSKQESQQNKDNDFQVSTDNNLNESTENLLAGAVNNENSSEIGIDTSKPGSAATNIIPLENIYPFQNVEPRFSVVETQRESTVELKPEPKHLYERVISDFQIDIPNSTIIKKHRTFFLDNLDYVERVLERSRPYLYYIVEEIEKRGLPTELALLPAIESAFLTKATSKSNAAGLWQFIPSTGRYFGLKQNWWSDQRRDVVLSTQSALDYLNELHIEFNGDWYLAIAAYNGGRGTVAKAIKRNEKLGKPTDYFSLKLSRETSNYVPKLLALVDVVKNSHLYNLKIPEIANFPYFTLIKTPGQVDMTELINKTALNEDVFYQLNAGFKRWASSPEGPHRLVVPIESSKNVEEYLAEQPKTLNIRWKNHKLKRGDTLYGLAKEYKVSVQAIKLINKMKSDKLREGKTILIPLRSA